MIGVIPKPSEVGVVQEFFQLFKTPWEFYVPQHSYDFLIVTSDEIPRNLSAKVLAVYNSKETGFDDEEKAAGVSRHSDVLLEWGGFEFPIYGDVRTFQCTDETFLKLKGKAEVAGLRLGEPPGQAVRLGYDLFQEVSFLLSRGQPPRLAHIPTLEIHIALLRSCMVKAGVPFVEVPPVPAGYDFMTCLTHDVDFVGIRQHKFDHTMWGFLYRALASSLFGALKGRMPWRKVVRNWKAALSLPLVHLGLQPDFWLEFDRYMQIEKDFGSTFFFIPYKDLAGDQVCGQAPKRRAAKYDVVEIGGEVRRLVNHGCEVGLHGIDAWNNPQKGRDELNRISDAAGLPAAGVRMHWLYFGESSPKTLEEAGFSYDSTFGYNDAVGFRAGTAQAFCPPVAENLLELPLHIQDTAMFYPSRMNLSPAEALEACKRLIECASIFGGVLTVNWHTRSLSPERLWDDFYTRLLGEFQSHRIWSGTGAEIIRWFRKRRALRFDLVKFHDSRLHLKLTGAMPDGQPPLLLRVFRPQSASPVDTALGVAPPYMETSWKGEAELEIAS